MSRYFSLLWAKGPAFAKGTDNLHLSKSASVITFTIKSWDFCEIKNDSATDKWLQAQKRATDKGTKTDEMETMASTLEWLDCFKDLKGLLQI